MEKLNVRSVIFDLGSTLIDYPSTEWEELSLKCVERGRQLLKKKGVSIPEQAAFADAYVTVRAEYRKVAAESLTEWSIPEAAQKMFENLRIEIDEKLVDAFFDAYYEPVSEVVNVYDDAASTLRKLRDRYETIGLVSNTVFPERTHLDELDRFGLINYFDFTIFSSTFGVRKPHEDIFYEAASLAGSAPAECVYIGDRFREDIEGPEGIGMHAILKYHPDREYPEDKLPSLRVIRQLGELADHLDI